MAPRARFELATLRLTAEPPTSSELAGVGANRRNSASCDETGRITFSFFVHLSFAFCPHSPPLVLRFYDSHCRFVCAFRPAIELSLSVSLHHGPILLRSSSEAGDSFWPRTGKGGRGTASGMGGRRGRCRHGRCRTFIFGVCFRSISRCLLLILLLRGLLEHLEQVDAETDAIDIAIWLTDGHDKNFGICDRGRWIGRQYERVGDLVFLKRAEH